MTAKPLTPQQEEIRKRLSRERSGHPLESMIGAVETMLREVAERAFTTGHDAANCTPPVMALSPAFPLVIIPEPAPEAAAENAP